jgi:hypothetical protein
MTTYKIMVEVVLKEDCLYKDDFIYRAIEEQLEKGEFINEYDYLEAKE